MILIDKDIATIPARRPGRRWPSRGIRLPWLLGGLLLAVALYGSASAGSAESEVWLLVDGGSHELRVMRGTKPLQTFRGISIGRGGIDYKRRRGDDVTPRGAFTVRWITEDSRFHRFIGFDYPSQEYAARGVREGMIDPQTYRAIVNALELGEMPPQHTPLGGHLGIHGIGGGDPKVHATYNWTEGCVALTNEQVDQLAQWVRVGTRVVIQ